MNLRETKICFTASVILIFWHQYILVSVTMY